LVISTKMQMQGKTKALFREQNCLLGGKYRVTQRTQSQNSE
jgi:hypothetical protein